MNTAVTKSIRYWMDLLGLEDQAVRSALVHPSHASSRRQDFQRYEYLGDGMLTAAVSACLFHRFADAAEGALTATRSRVVSREALAQRALRMELPQWIEVDAGHGTADSPYNDSILADALEVFIALVYERGGYDAVQRVVDDWIESEVQTIVTPRIHPKTAVKEWAEKRGIDYQFAVVEQSGPSHRPQFVVELTAADYRSRGEGSSIQRAEVMAAERLMADLQQADEVTV